MLAQPPGGTAPCTAGGCLDRIREAIGQGPADVTRAAGPGGGAGVPAAPPAAEREANQDASRIDTGF